LHFAFRNPLAATDKRNYFQPISLGQSMLAMLSARDNFHIYLHRHVPGFQSKFAKQLGNRPVRRDYLRLPIHSDIHCS
jgi:hypothetical protein